MFRWLHTENSDIKLKNKTQTKDLGIVINNMLTFTEHRPINEKLKKSTAYARI